MAVGRTSGEILARDSIHLGRSAGSQDEAIEFVGAALAELGLVEPSYADSMKRREESFSTYLGNGVALPHGTFDAKDTVSGTGIVIAQYPDGVAWGDGIAHLVIGLAATGEDHINVLAQLAEVLQDEELCERLWTTDDVDLVYDSLRADAP